MVFVGTATMMAAGGAVKPVYEVMAESGASFDPDAYIGAVGLLHDDRRRDAVAALQLVTPVLWVNRDAMSAAGSIRTLTCRPGSRWMMSRQ